MFGSWGGFSEEEDLLVKIWSQLICLGFSWELDSTGETA